MLKAGVKPLRAPFAFSSFLLSETNPFADKKRVTFTRSDCSFGYRESVFKNKYKGQFAILHVTFRLRKHPVFHTSYGALQQELEKRGVKEITLKEVAHAVMQIRSSKLPDPEKVGIQELRRLLALYEHRLQSRNSARQSG